MSKVNEIKLFCAGECSHDRKYKHLILEQYEDIIDVTLIEKEKRIEKGELIDYKYDEDGNIIGENWSESQEIELDLAMGTGKMENIHQIVKCGGCGFISYRFIRKHLTDFEKFKDTGKYFLRSIDDEGQFMDNSISIDNERPKHIEILFPKRGQDFLIKRQYKNIPIEIDDVYSEIIKSFNEGLHIIGTTGLRTLIESICNNQNIKGGFVRDEKGDIVKYKSELVINGDVKNSIGDDIYSRDIVGKIFGLAEERLISFKEASWIDVHRKLGNKSAHQGKAPPPEVIKGMIKIAEYIMDKLYESSKTDEIQREFEVISEFINKSKKL